MGRRGALRLGAVATALPLVHIRTAGAAGKLSVAFWDHWVPKGNVIMRKQVEEWAAKNKVDVTPDFVTSSGQKLQLTAAAEAQAKTGHDVMTFATWDVQNHAASLAPHDDVMKRLIEKYGKVDEVSTYLAKVNGHWAAVPTSSGTQTKPSCARISTFKHEAGIDVQAMYPAKAEHTALADTWTYDTFLKAAEACHKAGMTFGLGLSAQSDCVDWVGAMFSSFGAEMVNEKGEIAIDSDEMRQVLEYSQRLVKALPANAVSYDNASNNRALISGKSALIFNPPSAWAVAKRDAPKVAADCWTFTSPAGPKGRFVPNAGFFWGVWNFSSNQTAGKELIEHLSQRPLVEARCTVVDGYDLPPFESMNDFPVWANVEPPKGTVFNYPIQPWHKARPNIAASEAPPGIAVQMYNRGTNTGMLGRLQQGQSIPTVIAWAKDELAGFTR